MCTGKTYGVIGGDGCMTRKKINPKREKRVGWWVLVFSDGVVLQHGV